jgi:hypothetical protein
LLTSGGNGKINSETPDEFSRERLRCAEPKVRTEIVADYLAKQIAWILKVPLASVDQGKPIVNLGFDSLMSLELKNQIETDLGASIAMARLIQGPTISELRDWVLSQFLEAQTGDAADAVGALASEFEEGVL